VVRTQQGSAATGGKAAHHSQSLEAIFCHIPGWYVVAPYSPADAKGLLKAAIRDDNPVAFLEHKALYFTRGPVPPGDYTVPIGRAAVVREGRDLTLVAYSRAVGLALTAADALSREGVSTEVVDLRTLKPLDIETVINSVRKTHRAVVVHEAARFWGFGAELAATIQQLAFDDLDGPVLRVGGLDAPIPYNRQLERAVLPQVGDVLAAVSRLLKVRLAGSGA